MRFLQLVVFRLGDEEYALEITFAQEIIRIPERITKMPYLPSYIEGMIDLRGKAIPVIDLKERFGVEQSERGVDSRLLILNIENVGIGIIVDDVSEVIKVEEQSIERLNAELSGLGSSKVQGVVRIDERLILLLNGLNFRAEVLTSR
ncbi:chemotaxis protein CheW [Desulfosporosinus sp. FKB]|uniref:chemotaxis protein CheW n=1 Tax=Desulfosporosinus sp. FKB TaxID=1969835 RepID=UPI000B49B532|nr:chemotaxis protein CheW [Desulfosporosinus sp. FKB]